MDVFTRFNRKQIQDRSIDTLIGLSKGILADGTVNQPEAEFLLTWLVQQKAAAPNPIVENLLEKVEAMLQDKHLDSEEASEGGGEVIPQPLTSSGESVSSAHSNTATQTCPCGRALRRAAPPAQTLALRQARG